MEYIWIPLVGLLGGLIIHALMSAGVRAPGAALQKKFQNLGVLKGKTYSEITSVVGNPNSVSQSNGMTICQWMATGYHIVLLFDGNNICLGVNSETSV